MARISLKEREMEHKSKRGVFIAGDGVRPPAETKRGWKNLCRKGIKTVLYS